MSTFKRGNIFILLFITLILFNCGKNENKEETKINDSQEIQKKNENKKSVSKDNVKVTFIELGSVNCIPCRMMQPIMREIEEECEDEVKVVFYDVWTNEGRPFAVKYKIRVIPTQVFLDKDDKEYFRHEGFFPKDELVKVLQMKEVK